MSQWSGQIRTYSLEADVQDVYSDRRTPVRGENTVLWGTFGFCWFSLALGRAGRTRGGARVAGKYISRDTYSIYSFIFIDKVRLEEIDYSDSAFDESMRPFYINPRFVACRASLYSTCSATDEEQVGDQPVPRSGNVVRTAVASHSHHYFFLSFSAKGYCLSVSRRGAGLPGRQ
jgi:hypothetical protein